MSSLECTNSVFIIDNENNLFSITKAGHWETKSAEKTFDELNKSLEFRSQNAIELHVDQVRIKGIILRYSFSLSGLGTFKNEILEELKNIKYNILEDLVHRFELTSVEIIGILDLKYIPTKRTGYFLTPSIYEVVDLNNTLNYILHDNMKVSVTIDDVRLKSNLEINQILIFTETSIFYTILGFTRSLLYPLYDIDGFF